MKNRKGTQRKRENKPAASNAKEHESAYGAQVSICLNGGCVLRKKARCFGFEGCPGFKGK